MKLASPTRLRSLLLLAFAWSTIGQAAGAPRSKSGPHEVHFRDDDFEAQRIARKLLGREIAQDEDMSSGANRIRTAWVSVSHARGPDLFVMYGCSPTGNCDLSGFEPKQSHWRLVLNSLAQRCSILSSSHAGRRDILAYMHGSATEGTIKTYSWRRHRYVRASERDVIFK